MKFGKNIGRVVELSDPEWSPFWINYKFLKKKAKVRERERELACVWMMLTNCAAAFLPVDQEQYQRM